MPTWQLKGIHKQYRVAGKVRQALQAIDLALEGHEFLVILGPSGAGKTTLLRLLAGLERPDAGQILCDGVDLTQVSPDGRDTAMVFQDFAVYPHLTVFDNLAFPLKSRGKGLTPSEVNERVQGVAAMLGLGDKLQRQPGTLSGGEMQRVAIGRCLVRRPKLFLFDEPLVNLDAKLREGLLFELHRLQRESGTPMIYATQDPHEAMTLADRLALLDAGSLVQIGEPETLYRYPRTARIAHLLGNPPINLFSFKQAVDLNLISDQATVTGGGAPLWVGVRPESWQVQYDPLGAARIEEIAPHGSGLLLALVLKGQSLRALVPAGFDLEPGHTVALRVDPEDVQAFGA